jgi:hypothetical protein
MGKSYGGLALGTCGKSGGKCVKLVVVSIMALRYVKWKKLVFVEKLEIKMPERGK